MPGAVQENTNPPVCYQLRATEHVNAYFNMNCKTWEVQGLLHAMTVELSES